MPVYSVEHRTTYRYHRPVRFGEHRLLGRPHDRACQRLLDWSLQVEPVMASRRFERDPFGNIVTVFTIAGEAPELRVVNRLCVRQTPVDPYSGPGVCMEEAVVPGLARVRDGSTGSCDPRTSDPIVLDWARAFQAAHAVPLDLLADMARSIAREFTYRARDEEGTQHPVQTLRLRSGTCRDFAELMIEGARALGFAARFVTGYLYSSPDDHLHGGGATHAWLDVFVPGIGWVDFDPTNAIIGSAHLIRVAAVPEGRQAIPLSGIWLGVPQDFIGMEVAVSVTEVAGSHLDDGEMRLRA